MSGGKVLTQRSREAEGRARRPATAATAVPPLRFKGFTDAWEENRLGGLDGRWFKGQSLSKDEIDESGLHSCIHYGELFTRFGAVIDHVSSKTNVEQMVVSQEGDLLFPASDVTPDGLGRCSALLEENVVLGGDIIGLRQHYCDPIYLSYGINRERQQIVRLVTGTTVRHSSAEKLKNVAVKIAPDAFEQRKIGAAFREIDALIGAREEALEKLRSLKKAMLEKMFPQRGSRVPEVRFKGFDGEWEEKCIEDVGVAVTGSTPPRNDKTNWKGSFSWISAQDFRGRYISESVEHISDKGKKFCHVLPANTVLVTCIASIGLNGITTVLCATNQQINAIVNAKCDTEFLYDSICAGTERFKKLSGQTAVPIISKSQFEKFGIWIAPSLPEQRKIGAYFRSLDALISARREEIGKLKDLKKALLDRMFV